MSGNESILPPAPLPILGRRDTSNIKTSKIIMKTIAILALTAAALVSCQQQQQQQQTPTQTVEPVQVTTQKGK